MNIIFFSWNMLWLVVRIICHGCCIHSLFCQLNTLLQNTEPTIQHNCPQMNIRLNIIAGEDQSFSISYPFHPLELILDNPPPLTSSATSVIPLTPPVIMWYSLPNDCDLQGTNIHPENIHRLNQMLINFSR